MKRHLTILCLIICLSAIVQQFYHARVLDAETGEPLQYASIYVSKDYGILTKI